MKGKNYKRTGWCAFGREGIDVCYREKPTEALRGEEMKG